jgi:uncharacterized protein YxeA
MAEEKKDSKSKIIIIVLIVVVVVLIGGGVVAFIMLNNNNSNVADNNNTTTTTSAVETRSPILKYDEAAVALDENGLERQIQEMKNAAGDVSLEYKNDAVSNDGTHFDCYLANSDLNTEDMFIAIFKDASLEEQVYLSGLLRPGTSINKFESEIKFEPGLHSVVALFTSVGEDHETMTSQLAVEIKLTVNET